MPFIKTIAIQKVKTTPGPTVVPTISAGAAHSLLIKSTGRVWGWGRNDSGEVGNASNSIQYTPVSIAGAVKTFCKIAAGALPAGSGHSAAIDKNGRVWAWGNNNNGQLGDNTITARNTPVSVAGAVKTFCQISAGANYTTAIDKDGRPWSWGNNDYYQLGDTTTISKRSPVALYTSKTFCKISAGYLHVQAIDKNGQVWGWGYNATMGQLGLNNVTQFISTPTAIVGPTRTFCHIAVGKANNGYAHSIAIDKNGRAWGWGANLYGGVGNNTATAVYSPESVLGAVKTFCKVAVGDTHTVAIDKNGRAWAWGNNLQGQLGDNTLVSKRTPVSVAGTVKTFCEISAGGGQSDASFSLGVDKNGYVWAWGSYTFGKLGDFSLDSRRSPTSILGTIRTFSFISTGTNYSTAIDKNGRVWTWGLNSSGQLGDNTSTQRFTPVSILGAVKTFCQISGGGTHTVAIDKNGRAWAWGSATNGRLGDNQGTTVRTTPVSVLGTVKTFCRISTGLGGSHSHAIDKNGRAWSWGDPANGKLGNNQGAAAAFTPVSVCGVTKTFCEISAGFSHSLAIDRYGRAWAWGTALNGRLGDNQNLTNRCTPVSVLGTIKTFCRIVAGPGGSFAIDKNGRAWGWGINAQGQLGDNTITSRNTPVSVLGAVKTFCQISVGSAHTLALDKNGRVWAWGANTSGQLGDNTATASRLTPVSVAGAIKTFCRIWAGNLHSVAIDKNGRAWAWGLDTSGQLGLNTTNKLTPVRVCAL